MVAVNATPDCTRGGATISPSNDASASSARARGGAGLTTTITAETSSAETVRAAAMRSTDPPSPGSAGRRRFAIGLLRVLRLLRLLGLPARMLAPLALAEAFEELRPRL